VVALNLYLEVTGAQNAHHLLPFFGTQINATLKLLLNLD
jgi:hypothetical protein